MNETLFLICGVVFSCSPANDLRKGVFVLRASAYSSRADQDGALGKDSGRFELVLMFPLEVLTSWAVKSSSCWRLFVVASRPVVSPSILVLGRSLFAFACWNDNDDDVLDERCADDEHDGATLWWCRCCCCCCS